MGVAKKAVGLGNFLLLMFSLSMATSILLNSKYLYQVLFSWENENYLLTKNRNEIMNKYYSKFINNNFARDEFWSVDKDDSLYFLSVDKNSYKIIFKHGNFDVNKKMFLDKINTYSNLNMGSKNSATLYKFLVHSLKGNFDFAMISQSSNHFNLISPLYWHSKLFVGTNYYEKVLAVLEDCKADINGDTKYTSL